jgi:hypothetical protein
VAYPVQSLLLEEVVVMERKNAREWVVRCALAAVIGLAAVGAAARAEARTATGPTVTLHSAGGLAPDGRSISVQLVASCPERWTVVEAVVAVSQPQASGRASFPLTCIGSGSPRPFNVSVPAEQGTFELGEAQATASIVIKRGKTARTEDAQTLTVDPLVEVELAESARIVSGGGAVVIAVSVACPVGTTGVQSGVNVSQSGITSGNGSYLPVCDGTRHTFSVTVEASNGVYQEGIAQALTFANIEHDGRGFAGVDDDGALELVS